MVYRYTLWETNSIVMLVYKSVNKRNIAFDPSQNIAQAVGKRIFYLSTCQ